MEKQINVMIVDDEMTIRETLSMILEHLGYNVSVAEDGKIGLIMAQKDHYHVVITDIVMPEMNGVEASRQIKKISPDTKIIMMTGYGTEHPLVRQAVEEGIDYLFHKPLDLDNLTVTINNLTTAS